MADVWVHLRAGSDIAFLGGPINCVLANGLESGEHHGEGAEPRW
jgi:hypothetical protein